MSVARKMEAMPLRATSCSMLVVIELIAGMDGSHRERVSSKSIADASPASAQLVGPPAIHAHAFHALERGSAAR